MFTLNHFIWIGISLAIIAILLFISLKFMLNKKQAITIMAIIGIASELLKIFTHIEVVKDGDKIVRGFIEPTALPLHLCSIFIFVFIFLVFSKKEELNDKIISFFVPIGLVGALIAILLATSGVDFREPYSYQCFIYHASMVYLALYFIITHQVDLGLKAFIRNIIILFSLAIIMIWVNGALSAYDTNFFFVCRPPAKNLPILNLNHGWFVYFLSLSGCGLLIEFLVSLPYIIKELKNKNKESNKEEEQVQ